MNYVFTYTNTRLTDDFWLKETSDIKLTDKITLSFLNVDYWGDIYKIDSIIDASFTIYLGTNFITLYEEEILNCTNTYVILELIANKFLKLGISISYKYIYKEFTEDEELWIAFPYMAKIK